MLAEVTLLYYCLEDTRLDWSVSSDGAKTTSAGKAFNILIVAGKNKYRCARRLMWEDDTSGSDPACVICD